MVVTQVQGARGAHAGNDASGIVHRIGILPAPTAGSR